MAKQSVRGSVLRRLLAAFAITSIAQAVGGATFFKASSSPNEDEGITQDGGITTYVNPDGTYRVVRSSDGIPVLLKPDGVAMSNMLINANSGEVNVTSSADQVWSYVTPYSNFVGTGGYVNETGAVNGSAINATVVQSANATFRLSPSENYVLVLGNVSNPTNATYKLRTTGSKTLPGGQVVTVTMVPGTLEVLAHFASTGSATLDLQASMQSASKNVVVDFFLADQAKFLQLQQKDYVDRITHSPTVAAGAAPTYDLDAGPASIPSPTQIAGGNPSPTQIAGVQRADIADTALATSPPSPDYEASPDYAYEPTETPPQYVEEFDPPTIEIPPTSLCGDGSQPYFAIPPTVLPVNYGIKVETGARVSVAVNLKDYVGELYVVAYYRPPPGGSGPPISVSVAFRLSSTIRYPAATVGTFPRILQDTLDGCKVPLAPPVSAPPSFPPVDSTPPQAQPPGQVQPSGQAQPPEFNGTETPYNAVPPYIQPPQPEPPISLFTAPPPIYTPPFGPPPPASPTPPPPVYSGPPPPIYAGPPPPVYAQPPPPVYTEPATPPPPVTTPPLCGDSGDSESPYDACGIPLYIPSWDGSQSSGSTPSPTPPVTPEPTFQTTTETTSQPTSQASTQETPTDVTNTAG